VRPIPKVAMPVVEILRRDVPRPTETPNQRRGCLRWDLPGADRRCPMELHPKCGLFDFNYSRVFEEMGVSPPERMAFINWWDSLLQHEAMEAMDAIWPRTEPSAEAKP
jgi:hypothetical protein